MGSSLNFKNITITIETLNASANNSMYNNITSRTRIVDPFISTYIINNTTFVTVNIILHSIGIHSLVLIYKHGQLQSPQRLLLIYLSFAELLQNIARFIYCISFLALLRLPKIVLVEISIYVNFILITGLLYLFISALVFITLDRLLCVILGLKYSTYCTIGKTKTIIASTLFISLVICCIACSVVYAVSPRKIYQHLFYNITGYIATILYILFLIFAITSYSIMFFKLVASKRTLSAQMDTDAPQLSLLSVFRNSRFFISLLLISSFIVFNVVPALINSFHFFTGRRIPTEIVFYTHCSVALSDTVDASIYIFLFQPVRKLLYKNITSLFPTIFQRVKPNNEHIPMQQMPSTSNHQVALYPITHPPNDENIPHIHENDPEAIRETVTQL